LVIWLISAFFLGWVVDRLTLIRKDEWTHGWHFLFFFTYVLTSK
jgi:hypothetical protein